MKPTLLTRNIFLLTALLWLLLSSSYAQRTTAPAGLTSMSRPERLPFLYAPGTATKQFISVDHSSQNDDGNFLKSFTKYIDPNGEHVIFDEYGPGCLYRQQMNLWSVWTDATTLYPGAGNTRIKYYFDDEPTPRIDLTVDAFFGGKQTPFTKPLAFMDPMKRFAVLYYPFSFQKRLKVTIIPPADWSQRNSTWYQYTYHAYPVDTTVPTWSPVSRDTATVRRQWQQTGHDPKDTTGNQSVRKVFRLAPGAKDSLILNGAGSVAALHIHLEPYARELFFQTYLRIYWDGATTPAVDLPLGYFFGSGGEKFTLTAIDVPGRTLKTLFFGYDGPAHSLYAYWPMPYWKKARFELHNRSQTPIDSLTLQLQLKPPTAMAYPADQCGHFYAKRTLDTDNKSKPYARAFTETGRGHVVGMTFYTDGYDMDGDEFTYIDDSRTPQLHGDGTEDDHNQGWGGSNFQEPLWGGLLNGYQGAYRIYMNDAYVFHKNIQMRYEFSNWAGFKDPKTDVTVFYYKSPNGADTLRLTDQLIIGNGASEKAHRYRVVGQQTTRTLTSSYDGYEKKPAFDTLTAASRTFSGYCEFTVRIDPTNNGIKLRSRVDRTRKGPLTANVWVDGHPLTERRWHLVYPQSVTQEQAWGDTDFELPASYTRGKTTLKIRIASPDWNESGYQVYGY